MSIRERIAQGAKWGSEKMELFPGLFIEVRELSSGRRTAFGTAAQRAQKDTKSEDPFGPLYRKLLSEACYDPETGERVWPDEKSISDIDSLPGMLVEKIATVAFRVNGLDKEAKQSAKNASVPDAQPSSE
jgi:hypothetical protein